jgi:ribonuclease P protein component
MREVWRRRKVSLPPGYDIVLVAKRSATGLSYHGLTRQLETLGRKIRHAGDRKDS